MKFHTLFLSFAAMAFTVRAGFAAEPTEEALSKAAGDTGIKLVAIKPGTFTMGSPDGEQGHMHCEGPQTKVTFSQEFFLGSTPVTNAQYKTIMGAVLRGHEKEADDMPAIFTVASAVQFTRKLTDRQRTAGTLPEGYQFDLPTDPQWEYACRAGTTGPFDGEAADMAWFADNSGGAIHPVAQKKPSAWGLYDMHGNIMEWCVDSFPKMVNPNSLGARADGLMFDLRVLPGGAVTDPARPSSKGRTGLPYSFFDGRGGSATFPLTACRSASRFDPWLSENTSFRDYGLRVVLERMNAEQLQADQKIRQDAARDTAAEAQKNAALTKSADFQSHLPAPIAACISQLQTDTGIKLIGVLAGSLDMQDAPPAPQTTVAVPVTHVTLTRDYFLSESTVSQHQYESIMGINPSFNFDPKGAAPVDSVSWDNAIAFCRKLTEKEKAAGKLPNGYLFTLPTRAQWQNAALAGGALPDPLKTVIPTRGRASVKKNPSGANDWGFLKLPGNGFEWCVERYDDLPAGNISDPMGPDKGLGRVRAYAAGYASYDMHDSADPKVTFRIVLTQDSPQLQAVLTEPVLDQPPQTGKDWTPPDTLMEMKWIPPGKFTMGCPIDEDGYNENDAPLTKVTISRGFWLAATVRSIHRPGPGGVNSLATYFPTRDWWLGAVADCDQLNRREQAAGRLPKGYSYQLPTEAQWEYAARAGTTGPTSGDLDAMSWYGQDMATAHAVAEKKPNPWGLYDIYGLVPEWCSNVFDDHLPGGQVTDPLGSEPGVLSVNRVFRGCDQSFSKLSCRSAFRGMQEFNLIGGSIGYRIALAPTSTFPSRQLKKDAISYIISKGPVFSGTLAQGRTRNPVEASLSIDDKTQMVKGTLSLPSLKTKRDVAGFIIDDPTNMNDGSKPVHLELYDTNIEQSDPACTIPFGLTYLLQPDEKVQGQFTGSWSFNRIGANSGGAFSLQPGAAAATAVGATGAPAVKSSLLAIDPDIVGTWKAGSKTWKIESGGVYKFQTGANAEESGLSDFDNGNWRLVADNARADQGKYTFSGKDKLTITGSAGDETWQRSNDPVPPPAPVDPSIPAGMALIPAGSFVMGNSIDDPKNTVNVNLSAYFIDTKPITQKQWRPVAQFASRHGYNFDRSVPSAGPKETVDYPVNSVDWYDAVKWCNARSQMENLTPVYYTDDEMKDVFTHGHKLRPQANWAATGYRLPTDAEWEKAARGGLTGKRFPWGNAISEKMANYYSNSPYPWDLGPSGFSPSFRAKAFGGPNAYSGPVDTFAPNGYGLYAMAGNSDQWCWDWYAKQPAGGTDPHGPVVGDRMINSSDPSGWGTRVLRGGKAIEPALNASCAARRFNTPDFFSDMTAFRCVRSVTPQPMPKIVAPSADDILKQHQSVHITNDNGLLVYQFLAFPDFWSEPVIVPDANQPNIRLALDDRTRVQMRLNDEDVNMPYNDSWWGQTASKISFRSLTDKPVVVNVRIATRGLNRNEMSFVPPAYPPQAAPGLPADRQALHDSLLALVKTSRTFTGSRKQRGKPVPVTAELNYDEKLQMVTGWIAFENQGKKAVEGRVLDNPKDPPVIELAEIKSLDPAGPEAISGTYLLHLAPDGKSLTGTWSFRPTPWSGLGNNSAPLTLTPGSAK